MVQIKVTNSSTLKLGSLKMSIMVDFAGNAFYVQTIFLRQKVISSALAFVNLIKYLKK